MKHFKESMMNHPRLGMTALALAALAACGSAPVQNPTLEAARSDYRAVQAEPQAQAYAGAEIKQAGDALGSAEAAFARKDSPASVDQLAYLAKQRAALAQEAIRRKTAEASVAQAGAVSDKMRLASRTREADASALTADIALRDAAASQQRSADSQRQAAISQQQAAQSQQQAGEADARSRALEAQLRDLNAQKTDRGMVVTVGDVLFDTGRAELKSGGVHNIEKLVGFLKAYPQRKALIEGYTDSVGSERSNQELSSRRADAVRTAMVGMGVGGDRLNSQGYGETHPVAGNDSAGGRQLNRRVEIVLSDETGALPTR